MRKNRLHYCSLVHQCRYCDFPVNLDSSRPVAWTKVRIQYCKAAKVQII